MPEGEIIVVLGMHRSGTSAIAGILEQLGVALGNKLLPASDDNPKGYWEDIDTLALNEKLLSLLGSSYDQLDLPWDFKNPDAHVSELQIRAAQILGRKVAQYGSPWAFKDPRTSRLLRFWQPVIRSCGFKAKYVIALRNPLSVAVSLEKRNQIPAEKAYLLWLLHMLPAVLHSSGASRVIVEYDRLLADPHFELGRVARALALPPPSLDQSLELLDPTLRHGDFTSENLSLDCRVGEDLRRTYDLLSRAARDELQLDDLELKRSLETIYGTLEKHVAAFHYANRLEADKVRLYLQIGERDRQIEQLKNTLTEKSSAAQELQARINSVRAILSDAERNPVSAIGSGKQPWLASDTPRTTDVEEQIRRIIHVSELLMNRTAELELTVASRESELEFSRDKISASNQEQNSLREILSAQEADNASLKTTLSLLYEELGSVREMLSLRNEELTSVREMLLLRDKELESLHESLSLRLNEVASLTEAVSLRDGTIESLRREVTDAQRTINSARETVAFYQDAAPKLQGAIASLKSSMSWRITAPLRFVYGQILRLSHRFESILSRPASSIAAASPKLPVSEPLLPHQREPNESNADYLGEETSPPVGFESDITLVAFYLPQFHPIPENDRWWGKGFTEWANVARSEPQFRGHYQPHLPGELGFYDLRVKDVQLRQAALARSYGIGAFCFYFYWFGGTRLLELPIEQYANSPEIDLPFCLCWANEHWTRSWDGVAQDVLISQRHSPDDDLAFIEYVSQYMRNPRYLRIHGRPVLLVYRPSSLPDIRATADRWRSWARRNGLGELYLVYPQSFEVRDPADYGFDAATEFPPNLTGPPVLTDEVRRQNPEFSGIVYDWRALVERSRNYTVPTYKLFRGVCPSWDNTPRRHQSATIFVNSSPQAYQEWLNNAANETRQRLPPEERLIFVNAWNEWAEGAHLEPDTRYGYGWLHATRQALMSARPPEEQAFFARIVVVTHDAYPHGAQLIALNIVRELACSLKCQVEVVCLGDGPLQRQFAQYGRLHNFAGKDPDSADARDLAADLFRRGFRHALVNTTVSGLFLSTLKEAGVRCLSLVHELRQLIIDYRLQRHAKAIATDADCVVFPAPQVRDFFSEFASIPEERAIVRPQGLLHRNRYLDEGRDFARAELRRRLRLPDNAHIVIGVGYGDLRKGTDYFLQIAHWTARRDSTAHFVWVGHWEPAMRQDFENLAAKDEIIARHVHVAGFQEDTALFYAGADLFALTSREDPFPCVVLEAMHAGLPVVAFLGSGGSNALIEEGLGDNVEMGDVEGFGDAILRMMRDDEQRQETARVSREIIEERFSFRKYVFDLLKLVGVRLRTISVVIPSFNYERYLPDRLNSIFRQTYPVYELIFVDDASTDNSLAIARRLLPNCEIDHRIVVNQTNSGSVVSQWQRGVELAAGEIIWIAEADDHCDPAFLQKVVSGFDDSRVVLSYCESRQIDHEGRVLREDYGDYLADVGRERWTRPYCNDGKDEIRLYLAVKNTIPNASAVLMKRGPLAQVLREHVEDLLRHKAVSDWRTYLYLLSHGHIAYVPQSLNFHRRHRESVIHRSSVESLFREICETQDWVLNHYEVPPEIEQRVKAYREVLKEQLGVERALSSVKTV
jgi:glycosyltransferase involved in cell wall biosynthesis